MEGGEGCLCGGGERSRKAEAGGYFVPLNDGSGRCRTAGRRIPSEWLKCPEDCSVVDLKLGRLGKSSYETSGIRKEKVPRTTRFSISTEQHLGACRRVQKTSI